MRKFSLALIAVAIAIATNPAAKADTFSYSFAALDNPNIMLLTGTLNVTEIGNTATYDINSGTMNFYSGGHFYPSLSSVILAPAGTDGSDNQISVVSPYLSVGGFSFDLGSGDYINLYWGDPLGQGAANLSWGWQNGNVGAGGSAGSAGWYPGTGDDINGTFSLETPEPSSLFLLGTGLLALALFLFRKTKSSRLVLNM